MELHRLHRQVLVTHRHDDAVVGFGGHFEAGWEGLAICEQGMIAAYLESLRKSFKYAFAVMRHPGRLAVHGIVQHSERTAERLNQIGEQLAELDYAKAAGFLINGLKREQLIAMNSMILHELFFDGLGEQSEPGANLRDALARDFGSFERWRTEFVAMGKALGGGSGWVLLSWSPRDRKLVNQWASDHCHTLAGGTPILALDMYEHSYHIDFGAKAASYVDTFMDAIRWTNVERVFGQMTGDRGMAGETRLMRST